jgi:hypothetical protein
MMRPIHYAYVAPQCTFDVDSVELLALWMASGSVLQQHAQDRALAVAPGLVAIELGRVERATDCREIGDLL